MRSTLTRLAEEDLRRIARESLTLFGPRQFHLYRMVITNGIELVAADPQRPGSLDRSDIAAGIRIFPLALATGRRKGGVHVLYYAVTSVPEEGDVLFILRVLHQRMEPRRRILAAMATQAHPLQSEADGDGGS